jgi:hypothetical protein
MHVKSVFFAATLILSVALFQTGCKSAPPPAAPAQSAAGAPADSSSTAAQPAAAPGTSAAAPAASAGAPAVQPAAAPEMAAVPAPPPPPKRLTVPSGAAVRVTITEQLSASKNEVGDRFTGVLAEPLTTAGGATVFRRGARVSGTVVAAKGRGRFKGSGALGIQATSIAGTPVSASSYEQEVKGKGKRSAGLIGGGAGGGALIGGLAGGGKGALIGGLIGAGAGTAGAAFTGNKDVVIPSESVVTFHLTAPVTITVSPKPTE